MIGQTQLYNQMISLIDAGSFPRFCILVGSRGSGRKTLAHEVADKLGGLTIDAGISVADIRVMIENCHNLVNTTLHIIPDADTMSINAKNALLKITEEPPNNSYFIMTLQDENNTLDTIRSRATIFHMDNYSEDEMHQFAIEHNFISEDPTDDSWDLIRQLCDTPGEIIELCKGDPDSSQITDNDIHSFYDFVNKTVDNIAVASGANVFKISDSLKLKDDGQGYDIKLFLRAFIKICLDRYAESKDSSYLKGIEITSPYLRDLNIAGISKQGVIDLWILDIRKEWM